MKPWLRRFVLAYQLYLICIVIVFEILRHQLPLRTSLRLDWLASAVLIVAVAGAGILLAWKRFVVSAIATSEGRLFVWIPIVVNLAVIVRMSIAPESAIAAALIWIVVAGSTLLVLRLSGKLKNRAMPIST